MENAEIECSNDPEIERLGANAAAVYAAEFWNKLCTAARADARLLDPIWEYEILPEQAPSTNNVGVSFQQLSEQTGDAVNTRKIVLSGSAASDHKLYRRFRSNFGYFPVASINVDDEIENPLGSDLWASLLIASDGIIKDFNFMTLFRADVLTMFWMTEEAACPELVVIPRAQFLFIELARCKEGCYGRKFRQDLQLFDVKTACDALRESIDKTKLETGAVRALALLLQQWPCPYPSTIRTTGIVKILKQTVVTAVSPPLQQLAIETLQRWQDVVELGRLRRNQPIDWTDKQQESVSRAAKVLSTVVASQKEITPLTITPLANGNAVASPFGQRDTPKPTAPATQTTSSLDDLIQRSSNTTAVSDTFRDYGLVVLPDLVEKENVAQYSQQAAQALQDLCREQLEPRGLQVDGEEEFDFREVRQRPGHRVDNRYHILEPVESPIAALGRRIVNELPQLLFPEEEESAWQLVYAGVVHSFPRAKPEDPVPDAQLWHRDGPSVFSVEHHPTHCINVFVPLVDVSSRNGTTEFIAGTHDDRVFEEVASDVVLTSQQDPAAQPKLAVRADVAAGTAIAFDFRVFHRGLANASMSERPVLYFTIARDWFQEKNMFMNQSIIQPPKPQQVANQSLCLRLYQAVAGCSPDTKVTGYGHPHYTIRLDLLLLERLESDNVEEQAAATMNMSAILAFSALSTGDREALCHEFVCALNENAIECKRRTLESARRQRKDSRQQGDNEDFASISTDMSDVAALYKLTAQILLQETMLLSKLGFTTDEFGVCTALSVLKAFASNSQPGGVGIDAARLEESFTSWWHAGVGRFEFLQGSAGSKKERSSRALLVVFSSLGSGIARPEWQGSIRGVATNPSLDVLHVMDPAFSWYCQDPSCEWKGGEYYFAELTQLVADYKAVMSLGDSMGAAAALRFSCLANNVFIFTPQVDISSYEAITRKDFSLATKKEFERDLLLAVSSSKACVTIHYGEHCDEDVRQIKLLPEQANVALIAHDFDDHVLSLHLRDQGKLADIVETAVADFLETTRKAGDDRS